MTESMLEKMYADMGISKEVYAYGNAVWKELEPRFREIDETAECNQLKVVHSMQECQVSEACHWH